MNRGWAIAGGLAAALLVATQVFPDQPGAPIDVVLRGAVFGTGYGLLAVGLVLTYRTTRIINFAYGAMGGVGGGVAAGLTVGQGWSWPVAATAGVLVGVAVGAASERLIIRRFQTAPRLVLTVATIGLAQVLGGAALFMPGWLGVDALVTGFDTALTSHEITVASSTFNGNDLLLVAVVPAVLGALVWFLRGTDAGTAVRGMAENMDRARLVGIPVTQLSLLLWALTGGLAALTVVLRAPNEGLALDAAAGPTILLPGLAAAVLSGMSSLPAAFAAGVGVGVLKQLVDWNVERGDPTTLVMLVVVVVGLLVQHRPESRARHSGEGSWSMVGGARRLPQQLARLPEVRAGRVAVGLVVAAVLIAIPVAGSPSQINTATIGLTFGLTALSLVVLTGWGGVVSLGQVGLIGVGGVVMANALASWGIDMFMALLVCAVAGGLVALVLGIPALRVSGELLAVTTLAFAVAMQAYILNPANFDWLIPQSYGRPELAGIVDLTDERWLYVVALVLVAGAAFVVANLRAARPGRAISATRDNERSAAAAGVNTTETRLMAFALSGVFAGVAGGIHAVTLGGIGLNTYQAADSLLVFSMAVIGGVASLGGTLSGVALVVWLGYAFPRYQLLLTGAGLLVILMVLPGGLAQAAERLRDRLAWFAAHRRGLRVVDELELVDQEGRIGAGTALPAEMTASGLLAGAAQTHRPLLVCRNLEASYGSLQVLFGVDLAVAHDDMLALLGTNGAGKSTVLKSICGLLPPTAGKITFLGDNITGLPAEKIARLGLTLMPGGKGVFPTLTVGENLKLACWMLRRDAAAAAAAREDALAMFPVLRQRWDQLAGDLSGGEQQQLSLAMAFVTRPKLLCIDELSLGLAPTIVAQLVDKVHEMHARGTSIIVVEQSVNVAMLLCQRATFLEKGQVRFRGHTDGLLDQPDILRAVFLGGDEGDGAGGSVAMGPAVPPAQRHQRGVTLQCRELTKRFGGIRAVDRVSLTVPPATIVGLIGHNGAGKTTLFDVLTGYLRADGGQVLLDGEDITDLPPHRRAVAEVGRSFQEARLFPSLTVADALRVALETHLASREPVAAALRLPASTLSERSATRRVDDLIELLGLGPYRDRPTGDLSTGTRRIVELGCLLAQDPAVVLLDEPSAGIAQRETEALGPLLRDVQAETGCSMVVIEHDMNLLSGLCDHFVALEQGAVIAEGTPDAVLADARVIASYLGTNEDVVHRSGERRPSAPVSYYPGEPDTDRSAARWSRPGWSQPEWAAPRDPAAAPPGQWGAGPGGGPGPGPGGPGPGGPGARPGAAGHGGPAGPGGPAGYAGPGAPAGRSGPGQAGAPGYAGRGGPGAPAGARGPAGPPPRPADPWSTRGGPRSGEVPATGGPWSGEVPAVGGRRPGPGGPRSGEVPMARGPRSGEVPATGNPWSGEVPAVGGRRPGSGGPRSGEVPMVRGPRSGEVPSTRGPWSGEVPATGNPWSGEVPATGGGPASGDVPGVGGRPPGGRRPVGNWEAADERWAVVESSAEPPPDEPDDDPWPDDPWRRP